MLYTSLPLDLTNNEFNLLASNMTRVDVFKFPYIMGINVSTHFNKICWKIGFWFTKLFVDYTRIVIHIWIQSNRLKQVKMNLEEAK